MTINHSHEEAETHVPPLLSPVSGRLRRVAAGLAIAIALPLTMATSCDTGEDRQDQEEEQDEQEEDD